MKDKLRVLMYGWEFPPFISGGLGVACYAIVQELIKQGVDLALVLPYSLSFLKREKLNNFKSYCSALRDSYPISSDVRLFEVEIGSNLNPYSRHKDMINLSLDIEEFRRLMTNLHLPEFIKNLVGDLYFEQQVEFSGGKYFSNLIAEVFRYAALAGVLANKIVHDVIYAHDWLTVLAGLEAKFYSNAPVILHIHALEIDRSEGFGNNRVYAIEKYGMEQADQIIAVSQYTKDRIVKYYQIDPNKITVVHNGINNTQVKKNTLKPSVPVVLFVGRLTYQKGPYFFIEVANRILAKMPNAQFVLAGTGDLYRSMIERTAALKIGTNVHFTGFLGVDEVQQLYSLASVYVMPSISEPFGLTALEAAAHGIPVIVSKQSGVKEVLKGALVADFWDIDDLSNKILSLLCHPSLSKDAVQIGLDNLQEATWKKSVNKIIKVYQRGLKR